MSRLPLLKRCGGRRFLLTVGCGLVTSLLTWCEKIDANTYAIVICATVAVYIGGNTAQRIKAPQPPQSSEPQ